MKEFVMNVLQFLSDLGYLGIALGLMIEIIPSEIVLAYGGFMIAQGKISFTGAVIAGIIGGLIAQLILYYIGKIGGRPFVEKFGKYLFIHKKHLDMSERWFEKYGTAVVFFARFIPVVRHAISIPAGLSNMSLSRFSIYTTVAMIPWTILFLHLGVQLKSNWENIDEMAHTYVQPAMFIALACVIVYFVVMKLKKKKTEKI